jgi:hypothetical protein
MECKFCKHKFSNKQNLRWHQQTAKYCLKIQGKSQDNKFKCELCSKVLTSKFRLGTHMKTCALYTKEMNKLRQENDMLKKEKKYEKFNNSWYKEYFELQNAYRDLVNKYVKNSQDKISLLNKK